MPNCVNCAKPQVIWLFVAPLGRVYNTQLSCPHCLHCQLSANFCPQGNVSFQKKCQSSFYLPFSPEVLVWYSIMGWCCYVWVYVQKALYLDRFEENPHKHTLVYQEERNLSFLENFTRVLNEWSLWSFRDSWLPVNVAFLNLFYRYYFEKFATKFPKLESQICHFLG